MKILKFIILCGMLASFYSCQKNAYAALRDVERGLFLDRAFKVSTNTFFDRRLENNQKPNNDWLIVNQDIDYVYFGKVIRKNNYVMVAPFYKTDKAKLDTIFPGFTAIDGNAIKTKIFNQFIKPTIEERLLPICPQSYSIDYSKRKFKLTENGIDSDVRFTGKCYEDRLFDAKIEVLLSSKDLQVLNQEITVK